MSKSEASKQGSIVSSILLFVSGLSVGVFFVMLCLSMVFVNPDKILGSIMFLSETEDLTNESEEYEVLKIGEDNFEFEQTNDVSINEINEYDQYLVVSRRIIEFENYVQEIEKAIKDVEEKGEKGDKHE